MNAKKIIAVGLTALSLVGLASCGEEKQKSYSGVNTEINIWATAKEEAVIKKIVDKYNAAQTDETAKFNYKFTAVAEGDAGTTLAKDPTVAGAPALFLCADDHISGLANLDIVLNLGNSSYAQNIKANSTSVSVLGATQNNNLYGFPVTSDNGFFLWYNASKLTSADVADLGTLLAKAKSLNKKVLMDVPNGWYVSAFFASPEICGAESLKFKTNSDGKIVYDCSWDSEKGVTVAEGVSNILKPYYEDGTLVIGSNEVIEAGFQDGSMLAAVSGTWMESSLKEKIGDDTLAATKLPKFKVGDTSYQMGSFTGSKIYAINKTRPAAEQKAAAALAELLTNKESQLVRFEERQSIPCNKEAIKDARYTEHVSIGAKALEEQNAFAAVQSQSAEGRYWDIGKAIGQALIDGKLGEYTTWKDFMEYQIGILKKAA